MSAHQLLLADGRLPAGGHAHSGGVEAAVGEGAVHDLASLGRFLRGRLATAGRTDASLAAWACAVVTREGTGADWALVEAETSARIPSHALRTASRSRGRQLLRLVRRAYAGEIVEALGQAVARGAPHQTTVFGTAAAVAGLTPREVTEAVVSEAVTGPATAAVRLLALDPLDVQALLVDLAGTMDAGALEAAAAAEAGVPLATSAPLLDLRAERHATWEVRLFAS